MRNRGNGPPKKIDNCHGYTFIVQVNWLPGWLRLVVAGGDSGSPLGFIGINLDDNTGRTPYCWFIGEQGQVQEIPSPGLRGGNSRYGQSFEKCLDDLLRQLAFEQRRIDRGRPLSRVEATQHMQEYIVGLEDAGEQL